MMEKEYGLKINEVWFFYHLLFTSGSQPLQGKYYPFINGTGGNHCPGHDRLISDGYRLLVLTEYDPITHKLVDDSYSIIDAETMQQDTIALTTEETTQVYNTLRSSIEDSIYSICKAKNEEVNKKYSVIEAVRWDGDREAVKQSSWARFSVRAGTHLTGQQYAESRFTPKIEPGDNYLDQNIGKRTDLLVNLSNCLDEDLSTFDYISIWDEESDYIAPSPEEETVVGSWAALMARIPWNVELW